MKGSVADMSDEARKVRPEEESGHGFVEPISFPLFFEAAKLRRITSSPVQERDGAVASEEGNGLGGGLGIFHLFIALPMEIRLEIWKLALPGPRILEVYGFFDGRAPNVCNGDGFDMPLAESRAFITDYGYKPLLWPQQLSKVAANGEPLAGPWFCRGRDVVRDVESDFERLFRMCPPAQFLFGSVLER